MRTIFHCSRGVRLLILVLIASTITGIFSGAPSQPTKIARTVTREPALSKSQTVEQIPAPIPMPIPDLPALMRPSNNDVFDYFNAEGARIATFNRDDRWHTGGVTWQWESMNPVERERALAWIFDPQQIRYLRFDGQEARVIHAITKWIPRITNFDLPTDSIIAARWQSDGPPMNQVTLYEALSRIKFITLMRERQTCSYGYSHLGLIEFGGELILFNKPGWQRVSDETREIITTAWSIKEVMVIYYPQSLGWSSACPSEEGQVKNEFYSTIWLIKAQQTLSQWVPADASYWQDHEIPFQIANIHQQRFPKCMPATLSYLPTPSARDAAIPPH
ncbi:MAG: hypothetical protein HZC40_13345 [Chloroflexi bacterium]|nr:hypothetical protein [Chloroflexota bacterium]